MVRDDIPFDRLSAQIAHAARKSAGPVEHPNTHAIILSVPSEGALMHVYGRLLDASVACILIREPDAPFFGAPTCIGCFPIPRQKIRRLLSGLPLLRATDKP